jgi:hypothetical protein
MISWQKDSTYNYPHINTFWVNYKNETPSAILNKITLEISHGYIRQVKGYCKDNKNEQYSKMVEQLKLAGFPQIYAYLIVSFESFNDISEIKKFFDIIRKFEPIEEQTYTEMLRSINALTPSEELTYKIDMLIAQGKPQEAAVNLLQEHKTHTWREMHWYEATWNLVRRFEREKLVEPSLLIDLYQAISPQSPYFQEAQIKLYILTAPLNETSDEKIARHKQGLEDASKKQQILFIHHHLHELCRLPPSDYATNNVAELFMNTASTVIRLQEEVEEFRRYKASQQTKALLIHGTFAVSEASQQTEALLPHETFEEATPPSDSGSIPQPPGLYI